MSWTAIYLLIGLIFTGWFRYINGKTALVELLGLVIIWPMVALMFFLEWAAHTEI